MGKNSQLDYDDTITLLICSNRSDIQLDGIWKNVLNESLLREIIFVAQGQAKKYKRKINKVKYIYLSSKGRGRAINAGLRKVATENIVLTDDDCLLHHYFIHQANLALSNKSIDLVFGKTLPYKPGNNLRKFCPCTFSKKEKNFVRTGICKHWIDIGFDNNVAIKKKVFQNIGGYKWWLGPGSIGVGAEDAEFILRSLIAGYKIGYNDSMIVYHNKWLDKRERIDQNRVYFSSGLAAYGFYAFQGVRECWPMCVEHLGWAYNLILDELRLGIYKPRMIFFVIVNIILHVMAVFRGLFIAFIFAKLIPIPVKEDVVKRYYKNK